MTEVRKLYGYDDISRLRQDIKLLQHWIQKQEHFLVKDYDEEYLERHLICSKGSIERAKRRLDKLCTLRGLMPEYLQGLDIENEFRNALKVASICVLPKATPDNYRVVYLDIHNPDASLYDIREMTRYILMVIQYLCSYDYIAGIELLADTNNVTLGIMSKVNPLIATNTFMLISEALGLRVKGFYCVSASKINEVVKTLLKPCLSNKLASRMHILDRFEALHKYIPKEILPMDIGGDYPMTVKDINESNFKEFSSPEFIKTIKNMERAVTDESKRLSSHFNEAYSGMPGSFKVLSVD